MPPRIRFTRVTLCGEKERERIECIVPGRQRPSADAEQRNYLYDLNSAAAAIKCHSSEFGAETSQAIKSRMTLPNTHLEAAVRTEEKETAGMRATQRRRSKSVHVCRNNWPVQKQALLVFFLSFHL